MLNRIIAVSVVLAIALSAHTACAGGRFVPPDGKVLLIVGQDKRSIDDYIASIGIVPGGLMFYTSIQQLEGLYEPIDYGGGLHDGQYLAEKYPVAAMQIGLWMVGVLGRVADGSLDGNINKLGEWIKGLKRPVYLRIGYEFDFPENHYDPKGYIEAFRHIVDRMRKDGVDNVAFVWHSYASLNSGDVMQWYPGDDYVDWFGVSYFAQDKKYMQAVAALAKKHGKPLMVAEATPFGTQTKFGKRSWKNWFAKFFKFVSYYDVKAISYIDYDWETYKAFKGQGWGDARVEADDVVKAKWLEEIKKEKYLQSSPGLFKSLGYPKSP